VGKNTVSATAKFGGVGGAHGTAGVTAQQTAPPATYINIQATEEATFCDVFYIEDGYSQECEAIGNGTALDGVGGRLGSFSGGSLTFNAGASETNYSYASQLGGVCSYSKNCPVGQTATCGVGTVYKAAPCSPQFLEFYYIYFNFGAGNVCAPTGLAVGSNIPGNCD
jgi:hypothetical protein